MPSDFSGFKETVKQKTFGIVGLGLIGGSYAKALQKIGVEKVIGVDSSASTIKQALVDKVIIEGYTQGGTFLRNVDVVIFAVYPAVISEFLQRNRQWFKHKVVMTDVAGIKSGWLEQIDELLPEGSDFVSGHPMAGREGNGYLQASDEIFKNANYLIVPRSSNQPENVKWLQNFAYALGCKTVASIDEKRHDEIMAYTSNLPHLLAVALINSQSLQADSKNFIAGSFRDATRVADINADLWAELFMGNKDNVLQEMEYLERELQAWRSVLTNEDMTELKKMLARAAIKRKALRT